MKKINEKNVSLGDIERECKVNIYILRQLFNTVYDLEGRKINTVYFACERERVREECEESNRYKKRHIINRIRLHR